MAASRGVRSHGGPPSQTRAACCLELSKLTIVALAGGGNETRLNGTWDVALQKGELIVVTHSYRVNIFGFLAAEELRGRDKAAGSTGNYGIQGRSLPHAPLVAAGHACTVLTATCTVNTYRSTCSHGMDPQAHCKLWWRSLQGLHRRTKRRSKLCVATPCATPELAVLQLSGDGIRRILRRDRHGLSCVPAPNLGQTRSIPQLFYESAPCPRR